MLDKTWNAGANATTQPRYEPVVDCTYWPVLGPLNNCNIIHFTNKPTSSEEYVEVNQVVLDGITFCLDLSPTNSTTLHTYTNLYKNLQRN